jgi:AraC-like DNA-binding protein
MLTSESENSTASAIGGGVAFGRSLRSGMPRRRTRVAPHGPSMAACCRPPRTLLVRGLRAVTASCVLENASPMVAVAQYRVAGLDRGPHWRAMTNRLFGVGDISIGESANFHGEIVHSRVGHVDFTKVVSDREWGRRTAEQLAGDRPETFTLVNVISGSVYLQQGPRSCTMGPRTFTLYSASRPYVWEHRDRAEIRNIAIPGAMLRARLRNLDPFLVRPCSDQTGLWGVTSDLIGSAFRQLAAIPDTAAHGFATQVVDMACLALGSGDDLALGETCSRAALYRRCLDFMRSHVADDRLDPDMIARAMGISVRSLHRVFREHGSPVCDTLRGVRLEACRAELADPANAHLSIGEIAWRCGFRNQAHFANAFKSRYGMTAKEWRQGGAARN